MEKGTNFWDAVIMVVISLCAVACFCVFCQSCSKITTSHHHAERLRHMKPMDGYNITVEKDGTILYIRQDMVNDILVKRGLIDDNAIQD